MTNTNNKDSTKITPEWSESWKKEWEETRRKFILSEDVAVTKKDVKKEEPDEPIVPVELEALKKYVSQWDLFRAEWDKACSIFRKNARKYSQKKNRNGNSPAKYRNSSSVVFSYR